MEIVLVKADITTVEIDAIVNAANPSLLGGAGVDGAIHRKGGKEILKECMALRNKQGNCGTGEAVITSAGNLPAKKVIHTVGPVWRGGNHKESELLKSCYVESLKLAEANALSGVAFPNISTGVYGFPIPLAAEIAINAVENWHSEIIKKVVFVCFHEDNYQAYLQHKGSSFFSKDHP